MNTSFLRSFAVNARNELMERIKQKAYEIGITEEKVKKAQIEASDAIYINGKAMDQHEVKQRNSLIEQIHDKGYSAVIEEVAYTWFNRFCALRFMEVNDYLPTGVRVLSSTVPGSVEPDILREALNVNLNIDREVVFELKEKNDSNSLFQYMIVKQCNSLHSILPFLFEKIEDYTEILFPDNLLNEASFLRAMVNPDNISEEDWQDVEIIGWLYQYYISEKKDQVFADLKKNIKISKENIPAATQLFTPNWIVCYMVENSLGRLWMLNHPNSRLAEQMEYYIKTEQDEKDFLRSNSPEEIKVCDPACGSGHMLVYAFDLLYAIYEEEGYVPSEIPAKIMTHNLYGIEIDERAGELAAFALVMKARQKYRRFFRKAVQPHICVLENIHFEADELKHYQGEIDHNLFTANLFPTLRLFEEADNFGSLIRPALIDVSDTLQMLEARDLSSNLFFNATHKKVVKALQQADFLSPKYHVVIANPPYMGGKGMNTRLKVFAEENYPDGKSDLFAMFIERNLDLAVKRGLVSMITMQSWMFLSSFEKLRENILDNDTIISMAHLGARAFDSIGGEVVSTTAFVINNEHRLEYKGAYLRLIDGKCEADKEAELKSTHENPYLASAADFKKIPGSPIAYWISEKERDLYYKGELLGNICSPRKGLDTGENEQFIRLWHEVLFKNICLDNKDHNKIWFPYNKGGNFRRWYGNREYLINWYNDGQDIKARLSWTTKKPTIRNADYYFKEGYTWTTVSSGGFSARYSPKGSLFDNGGCTLFADQNLSVLGGFVNSRVMDRLLEFLSPTLNFQPGDISRALFPKTFLNLPCKTEACVEISRSDWDFYETSWDFTISPLLIQEYHCPYLRETYTHIRDHWLKMTLEMQSLEEENNRIFIEAYGLQDELNPEVPLSEITLTCNPHYRYGGDKIEEELEARLLLDTIKEYISYAVGCMFGRYSLDHEGLAFAGGDFDPSQYQTFPADSDNVIPILAEDYFSDDIVTCFVDFVRITFSEATLEQNLDFIADTLGRKANESSRDSIRRYFLNDFYKDHVQTYKKRPIYWMFTSGREKAFNCLVYLHRYQSDTIATIRTEYLHRLQEVLDVEKQHLQRVISDEAGSSAARSAAKKLVKLDKQILEMKKYEEVIHHYADMRVSLDLDDGVKVNYTKLDEMLAKI